MMPPILSERSSFHWILPMLLAGAMGVALTLSGNPLGFVAVLAVTTAYLLFGLMSICNPLMLVAVLLLTLEILPPFYFGPLGETPIFASFLLLPVVLAVIVVRLPDIRFTWDPIATGLSALLVGTALSIPFAFWLSGMSTGMNSLSRWILMAHVVPIYYLIRGLAHEQSARAERWIYSLLFGGAVLSAAYGIVDFVWPIPLAHPAADQYIWLEGAVLRRAQGPFYESSNFANFCGFFLIAGSIALLARKEKHLGFPRPFLALFISILSLAVLVAFSRSAWGSVLIALLASLMLSRLLRLSRALAVLCTFLVPICFVWIFSPGLWDYLVNARVGRLFEILVDPNSATSGRFETWIRVLSIIRDQPQYLFFGIGYKTLTVTRLFHGEIITDNGYLSLLLECGFAGVAGFALLSRAIFRTLFRLARSAHDLPAFWGTVLFAIWCGELVQLLATDAHTYWRNITIFVAMAALTLNLAERKESSMESV
jgi:hypothetical protein